MMGAAEDAAGAMHGARVLITGGLGFIGSNLARRLVTLGAEVSLVDSLIPEYGGNPFNIQDFRKRVEVHVCDVRDPHAMRYLMQGQDIVFNLAGQTSHLDSMHDPHTDLAINVAAQLSLLETCRKVNPSVRLVFASTRQVYGIRASVLRLTNTYGPGMRVRDARQTFLGIWIRRLLEGRPLQIFGDGAQLRDFNYVEDCVDALLLAAGSASVGGVFNLGSDEVVSLNALAELLIRLHGSGRSEVVAFPEDRKRVDIGDYYSDYSRFSAAADWAPRIGLEEGLRRTLAYYRAHRDHYWTGPEAAA